ncbi:MAG: TetR/AcrR family transcriptional regulator [Myxococcota bacterium]
MAESLEALGSRPRGRPRDPQVRDRILETAMRLVQEGGRKLSIEKVAADAGVSKQTIYRWWPSRGELVLEALLEFATRTIVPRPDGSPERALTHLIEDTVAALRGPIGDAVRSLLVESQLDSGFLPTFRDRFVEARREVMAGALESSVGELDPERLTLMLDCLFGSIWYRLLVGHAPLDERFATDLTAAVATLGAEYAS